MLSQGAFSPSPVPPSWREKRIEFFPLVLQRYANTLEKISWYGPDFFYTGETAINTAAAAYARGGILTTKDLANYTSIVREPVNITYRNSRIFSTVAPSSGAVVLSALKIFEVSAEYIPCWLG